MIAIIIAIVLAVIVVAILKTWADNGYRLSEAEKEDELKYWWKGVKR